MEKKIEIVESSSREESYGINASNLIESEAQPIHDQKVPKKRGGRSANVPIVDANNNPIGTTSTNTFTDVVTLDKQNAENKLSSYEKKVEQKYHNQVGLIAGVIQQTDDIMANISAELQNYRSRPSYGGKGRMLAMTELQNSQVSLLNTKLAAVRELNNVATKIIEQTARHEQQMKDSGEDASDRNIMKLYEMMLNPTKYNVPHINNPLHVSSINTGIGLNGVPVSAVEIQSPIVTATDNNGIVTASQPNLTPEQNRMILEGNPNIKAVVVYNQSTGSKRFDVVDVSTGVSIPNVPRPAPFLLDDAKPDFRNGIALNSNANMSWPLVIEGTRAIDEL